MAIAGMILGITSIVPGLLYGKGMAIAGLTTSIINLLLALAVVVMFTSFNSMMTAVMEPVLKMLPPGLGK